MAVALAAFAVVGCAPTSPSPEPSTALALEADSAGIVIGCADVEAAECQAAAAQLLGVLPPGRPRPFDIQLTLMGCANQAACPQTLAAQGAIAYVEYADGLTSFTYTIGGDPWILGPLDNGFTDPITPTSARVGGAGPFPFQLGHCGLSHVVDFDGSFWVPIGQIDADASGFVNGESGLIRLLEPNLAQYAGTNGFVARLARFPGAKRFWLCA